MASEEWAMAREKYRRVDDVCFRLNAATNPAKLRTDDEHAACRAIERRMLAILRYVFVEGVDWEETDSGRFYALNPRVGLAIRESAALDRIAQMHDATRDELAELRRRSESVSGDCYMGSIGPDTDRIRWVVAAYPADGGAS